MIRRLIAAATLITIVAGCSSPAEPVTPAPPSPAASAAPSPPPAISPVLVRAVADPIPVPATDGKLHLAYELVLSNATTGDVSVTSLAVNAGDRTLLQLPADRLAARTHVLGKPSTTLGPGQNAYVWLDVVLPNGQAAPANLTHAVDVTVSQPKPPLLPASLTETVGTVTVQQRTPVIINPPLRGVNWLDANGCCGLSAHRGALNPIDGELWAAERFAIDYLQLLPDRRLFSGDGADVREYAYFGADVHAVADGPVVAVLDGLPEQKPLVAPDDLPLDQYSGNHVVQDLGNGNYALYAHLKTGSVSVKPGDRLSSGQVLGRVGNSGNTDAPHLHFHVMSTPDPLRSDGLPFVFSSFQLTATVPDSQDALLSGRAAPMTPQTAPRAESNVMPLQNDLMSYGS